MATLLLAFKERDILGRQNNQLTKYLMDVIVVPIYQVNRRDALYLLKNSMKFPHSSAKIFMKSQTNNPGREL